MWNSIENLKQNLNKIALDVHESDDEQDLPIHDHRRINGHDSPVSSGRRSSNRFAHSNGVDSPISYEIEKYMAEIWRLKESESELKALSVNYAALMKEKEDQLSRLNQENGSLKRNLDVTREAMTRASASSGSALKGLRDQSPGRKQRSGTQLKGRYVGHLAQNGVSSKLDVSNEIAHVTQSVGSQRNEQEFADLLEEKDRFLSKMQATHERQLKNIGAELEKERDQIANLQLKLKEEQQLNVSIHDKLHAVEMDKKKMSDEMSKMDAELDKKISEIKRLQSELSRQGDEEADDSAKSLKRVIAVLETENANLKMANSKLEVDLENNKKMSSSSIDLVKEVKSLENAPRMQEMELKLQKLEKDVKQTSRERDKALQELKRLKQHLLEKASEEAEKMDEDSKIIEELRRTNEYQKAQLLQLEKALKQAIASKEEGSMVDKNEIQKSKKMIENLNKQLADCMSTIESKNVELLNLQTALGQYFAEVEAKEHLERQLALAKEELSKSSMLLKNAEQGTEASKREKDEVISKLSHAEKMLAEWKNRVNKLEEDNAKLRRAVEQSMTRLNRMSVDSDFLVDRRIVIKLLVTYFQRNHSKEVLDLMVRMLGFSNEDKQRIGVAQQGGKGVVRGVLGLPGRLVGGILGGSSGDVNSNVTSEDQSFADLWVDFLLKETEEREKRESMDEKLGQKEDLEGRSPSAAGVTSFQPSYGISAVSRQYGSPTTKTSPPTGTGYPKPFEPPDSGFSTVPLTSLNSGGSRFSRLLEKH